MYMNYFKHETTIIDEGCSIGAGTKIWHFSHVMPGCEIGAGCNIGQNVVVSPGVVLGRNVKVQNNVSIYTGVVCEDDVFLGPSMVFTNVINPRSAVVRREEFKQTLVRKGASIGANATVVCGNEIGAYAMVGAGAVITKPVLPYALVVGNPARQIGWVSEFGNRLEFDEEGFAVCEESGDKYKILDNVVVKIE
jgi:UDP-2-acetamido-3-amino-2,3-dideoxy-glucuronate N-acetyltransferase